MGNLILTFILVILFAVSCRGLMTSIRQPVRIYEPREYFSVTARRIEKFYKITAWIVMSVLLFISLLMSFWDSFTQIPH